MQTKPHHGHNIKRIREIQGIKQEALAMELGADWNQKKISLLESKELVDIELLQQVAKALRVTPEAIESYDPESTVHFINSFSDNSVNNGPFMGQFGTYNFNPIDKWIEALEENKKLYERLLESEREKVRLLEGMLKK